MKDKFASRLKDLGTETAFSVSQDAAEFVAVKKLVLLK